MNYLLVADIGNTNITIGIFSNKKIVSIWRISSNLNQTVDEFSLKLSSLFESDGIEISEIHNVSLCSVVPNLTETVVISLKKLTKLDPIIVGSGIKTGISIKYDRTQDVGTDRIADAVAAHNIYGAPLIIVDIGTAIVFDAIFQGPTYMGGAISPGIQISAEAMYKQTSQLRKVELKSPKFAIGKTTIESMQSGFLYGFVDMIEGMVKRIKNEFPEKQRELVKVVVTGGLSHLIIPNTNIFDEIDPDLTLHGLRIINEINT